MTIRKMCASVFLTAAAGLAASIGSPSAAQAKEVTVLREIVHEDQLTGTVSYADLDLASPAGARALNMRVGNAVLGVCEPLSMPDSFAQHSACRSFAWAGARPQIDSAIARARQLASTGVSAVAPVAIRIAVP
jgi:UrcA family protein